MNTTSSGPGWTCAACGMWTPAGMGHSCGVGGLPTHWLPWPDFKKCPTCGLEWRGAGSCPNCALTFAGYNKVKAERDEARDWCRMLVVLVRTKTLPFESKRYAEYKRVYAALPPELWAAIEEAK